MQNSALLTPQERRSIADATRVLVLLRTSDLDHVLASWSEASRMLRRGSEVTVMAVSPALVGGQDGEALHAQTYVERCVTRDVETGFAMFTARGVAVQRPHIVQEGMAAPLARTDQLNFDLALLLAGPHGASLAWCRTAANAVTQRRGHPAVVIRTEARARPDGILSGIVAAMLTSATRRRPTGAPAR